MTQDEIIRMAREAGWGNLVSMPHIEALERFAALVAAHEREKQAEQEPVGRWNWNEAKFEWLTKFDYHKHHMTPLYAAPQPVKQEHDDLDWITPEAVFEAKLKLHGIPNPPVQPVKQEPVGVVNTRGGINWRLGQKPLPPRTHLYAAPVQQEPVGTLTVSKYKGYENGSFDYYGDLPVGSHNLYAAPVRTKDLTDDEIRAVLDKHCGDGLMTIAYAVIAADREKNK